jgi:Fe-S oxidoreductase
MLKGRMARSGQKSVRELLHFKETNTFYAISDPGQEIRKSVIYFPGCGSERMFPDISFATLALLFRAGIRVVLPPEYLCCGYPLLANGKVKQAEMKSFENRVIFHRMAETIGYMDIHDVIVTCGTCYEMLGKYQIENIFQNSGVNDLSSFIARENLYRDNQSDRHLIYHDPCHSPLKDYGYKKAFDRILANDPSLTPNCCGEGGTLALSTPGISVSLRERKSSLIDDGRQEVITTCPSCVQGLSKIEEIAGTHFSQYLARTFLGDSWKKDFIRDVKKKDAVERIIF